MNDTIEVIFSVSYHYWIINSVRVFLNTNFNSTLTKQVLMDSSMGRLYFMCAYTFNQVRNGINGSWQELRMIKDEWETREIERNIDENWRKKGCIHVFNMLLSSHYREYSYEDVCYSWRMGFDDWKSGKSNKPRAIVQRCLQRFRKPAHTHTYRKSSPKCMLFAVCLRFYMFGMIWQNQM